MRTSYPLSPLTQLVLSQAVGHTWSSGLREVIGHSDVQKDRENNMTDKHRPRKPPKRPGTDAGRRRHAVTPTVATASARGRNPSLQRRTPRTSVARTRGGGVPHHPEVYCRVASAPGSDRYAQVRSNEQQCSVVRNEVQSVFGEAQPRERWRTINFAGLKSDVRNHTTQRRMATGATEGEWHQQRMQLECAIGLAEAQTGSQQWIIDEQAGMIFRAERYVADLAVRAGLKLSAANEARTHPARQRREATMREERMRSNFTEAIRAADLERSATSDLKLIVRAAESRMHRPEETEVAKQRSARETRGPTGSNAGIFWCCEGGRRRRQARKRQPPGQA